MSLASGKYILGIIYSVQVLFVLDDHIIGSLVVVVVNFVMCIYM